MGFKPRKKGQTIIWNIVFQCLRSYPRLVVSCTSGEMGSILARQLTYPYECLCAGIQDLLQLPYCPNALNDECGKARYFKRSSCKCALPATHTQVLYSDWPKCVISGMLSRIKRHFDPTNGLSIHVCWISGKMGLILARLVSYLDKCLYDLNQSDGSDLFKRQ